MLDSLLFHFPQGQDRQTFTTTQPILDNVFQFIGPIVLNQLINICLWTALKEFVCKGATVARSPALVRKAIVRRSVDKEGMWPLFLGTGRFLIGITNSWMLLEPITPALSEDFQIHFPWSLSRSAPQRSWVKVFRRYLSCLWSTKAAKTSCWLM